jgi:hypothetical protein
MYLLEKVFSRVFKQLKPLCYETPKNAIKKNKQKKAIQKKKGGGGGGGWRGEQHTHKKKN